MTKLFFCFLAISTGKLVWVNLCTNSIDAYCEIMVCNCCVSGLDPPKWFGESIHGSGRIINNLCSIQPESHPMQRMMPTVTDIYSNFSKFGVEYWVSTFSLHIISGLIEISYPGDMALHLGAQNIAMVVNHYCRVVQSSLVLISFQDRRQNYHVVLDCQFF